MNILIAPDSFKGSLTATQAAHAMAASIQAWMPNSGLDLCPMADGGEGTVEALVTATAGDLRTDEVTGPLGQPTPATWGTLGIKKTAVIETASAAGLQLLASDQLDPTKTTTLGLGQLIIHALDQKPEKIIIGLGGSATNDAGAGMAQALGVKFFDSSDKLIQSPLTGESLTDIARIDTTSIDPRITQTQIIVACDVTNPLTGPNGAAQIYSPQKGATPTQVKQLDKALIHFASLVNQIDPETPGAGSAGGLGFGLLAFCNVTLTSGIALVMDAVDFDTRIQRAQLVLTGEGKLDAQSINGKTCIGVAQRAAKFNVPTVALVGAASPDAEITLSHGLNAYRAITDSGVSNDYAMQNAAQLLQTLTQQIMIELQAP